ncbi:hypothetical protein ACRQ5D_31675 [Mucilaginibacter sp. P25]|uniref:hypothetical protein n=1 Tax=Mucilaginibacter sp. P25 TaxID=3423945 RepID=UPI003D7B1964
MNELIKKTEEYIINLLGQKLAVGMVYHNLDHTQLMVAAVNDLCTEMHLNEWEQEILMVSAWFHDSGYCYTYQGHEAISMTIAGDFLRSMGKKICSLTRLMNVYGPHRCHKSLKPISRRLCVMQTCVIWHSLILRFILNASEWNGRMY